MPPDDRSILPSPSSGGAVAASDGKWQPPGVARLQELLPQYEVLELLGRGGMGAVYKARQRSLRRVVAIKILPVEATDDEKKFSERFKNEAFGLAQLSHPGIVNVHDAGEAAGGLLYFVMEYVEGRDLAHEIAARKAFPQEEVRSIAMQVCEALTYLHSHGIIHRDIKPANILLNAQGRVKVADFGLAKLDEALATTMLTCTGISLGTADFMAPECRRAAATVDHRADLFALGVMLYQMLTGELPRGMFKLPSQIVPDVDERFDDIICKALEPKPEDRYPSAKEMRDDLAALASARSTPASSVVANAPTQRERTVKQSSRIWPMIGAVVVVILAGLWFFLSEGGQKPGAPSALPAPATDKAQEGLIKGKPVAEAAPDAAWRDWLAPIIYVWPMKDDSSAEPRVGFYRDEGGLSTDEPMKGVPALPPETGDGAVRLTYLLRGSGGVQISARARVSSGVREHYFAREDGRSLSITRMLPQKDKALELVKKPIPPTISPADERTLEFRFVGDQLTATLNGSFTVSAKDATLPAGQCDIVLRKGVLLKKVEVSVIGQSPP